MSKIVTIVHGQSIWDIAVQEYGSIASVFDFVADNAFPDGLDTILTPGQKVKITSAPSDMGVLGFIQSNKITVAGGGDPFNVNYVSVMSMIGFTQLAGDSYSYEFFAAPTSTQSLPQADVVGYSYSVVFWSNNTDTLIDSGSGLTVDYTGVTSGNGAGVYEISCNYLFSNGMVAGIQCIYLVDGLGNIIAALGCNGAVISNVSGTSMIAIPDIFSINYPVDYLWGAFTPSSGVELSDNSPVVVYLPIDADLLVLGIKIDSTFTNDFGGDGFFYLQTLNIV